MLKFMSSRLAVAMLLAATYWGGGYVHASAPEAADTKETVDTTETEKGGTKASTTSTKSVTESETKAKLTGAAGQAGASGCAESDSITVTNNTTSTTNSVLTVSVKRLTLANGSTVTFNLNGSSIGTGKVSSGKAKLTLSTKKGNSVPSVKAGDTLTVVDPSGATDLTGMFGAVSTEAETSGR